MAEENKQLKENQDNQKEESGEIGKLKEELEKVKKEKEEFFNGWQRERADFLNYKKDEEKRFQEIIRFSNERIIKSLIPVLDSLELAINSLVQKKQLTETEDQYLKGLILIYSQIEDLFKKEGVEIINPQKGEEVDPRYHEAISETETQEVPSKKICQVLEKGYLLNGKLIRPARVIVAK
ncbi:MAG: nucleotide exchange factor GrpE [Minisyncoccia bacterium]